MEKLIKKFSEISIEDTAQVDGKNSSLVEIFSQLSSKGIRIPDGFATTAFAFRNFLEQNKLNVVLQQLMEQLDKKKFSNLKETGDKARETILQAKMPDDLQKAIIEAYKELRGDHDIEVAVRSSATAEDLPQASFAGQHETYLNIKGEASLVKAVQKCYSSLYTDRAIKYREDNHFEHQKVALSVGVQKMVRSDKGCAGVAFKLEPESGFRNVIHISGVWGLGENIVQGAVNPDEFYVFKPTLLQNKKAIIQKKLAVGVEKILNSPQDADKLKESEIVITDITSPDWDPILKKSGGIVANKGGRTSHAAIVARELGVPAIVGCSDATEKIKDGEEITVSCAEGRTGNVYKGKLKFEEIEHDLRNIKLPESAEVMMILGEPDIAFKLSFYPNKGVGLMRIEFIITHFIQVHPMALVKFNELKDKKAKQKIEALTNQYPVKEKYFTEKLAEGVATIAAAFHPKDVLVRMSDFKTNEYANLLGGREFEPNEENPMLGFRGASRYYNDKYKEGFRLECEAIKMVREEMGFTNVMVMVPFCRTVDEADKVIAVMEENGLSRITDETLKIYMMVEIPSNELLANEFAKRFDGFSIGSNDLTQLILGIDRDSAIIANLFDEQNKAVKEMIASVIKKSKDTGTKIGLCGQAPSDFPEFASFLIEQGIDSISFNPDALLKGIENINKIW